MKTKAERAADSAQFTGRHILQGGVVRAVYVDGVEGVIIDGEFRPLPSDWPFTETD